MATFAVHMTTYAAMEFQRKNFRRTHRIRTGEHFYHSYSQLKLTDHTRRREWRGRGLERDTKKDRRKTTVEMTELRPHVCTSPRADRWTDGCCTSIFFCVIVSSGVFFHAGCGADEAGFPRQRNLENVISIACIVVVTSLVRSGSSTCWTGWLIAAFQRAFLETSLNANTKAVLKKNPRESTPRLPF